jgi:phage terminase large subunit-like protein
MSDTQSQEERKARIAAIKAKLDAKTLQLLNDNPEIVMSEIETRDKHFPSKSFVPNIAQERALGCCRERVERTGMFCKENHFLAGNGVGKTAVAFGVLLPGVTLGEDFLNPDFFKGYEFFTWCAKVRRERALKVRIVCDASDMEEQGSVTQQIRKWMPMAELRGKVGGGQNYYTEVRIPAPYPGMFATVVDVKTHGQRTTAHAGSEVDVLIFNEPPPQNVYDEEASRTRKGGYIFGFLTPLNAAPYLIKVLDAPAGTGMLSVTHGSIWDNCCDIPGNRGVLTKFDIENQIRRWMAQDPMIAEARIYGKFMQLSGSIFKAFNPDIHVISPVPIGPNWNIFFCFDPHKSKPPFAVWMALSPLNDWYVIAEYPSEPWDQINTTHLTIKDFCADFLRIERGMDSKFSYMARIPGVVERFGDPNQLREEQPHNRKTYKTEYELHTDWQFNVFVNDNVEMRHDRVKDLIKYDPMRPIDSMNRPHLYVFNTCDNVRRSMSNYSYKMRGGEGVGLSNKVDEEWECPVSCVGYTVISVDGYSKASVGGIEERNEWEEVNSMGGERYTSAMCGQSYSGGRVV